MKNMGDKFKLLLLPLAFVCVFFAAAGVFTGSAVVSSGINLSATEVSVSTVFTSSSMEFSKALARISSRYPADDHAIVFFNKDTDLMLGSNGNYLVTEETFVNLTDMIPVQLPQPVNSNARTLTTPVYDLQTIAAATGYNVNPGERNIILTRPYGTKRLLIQSDTTNLDLRGAVAAASYNGLHIHQYATESATNDAYNYYLTLQNVDSVSVDSFCWIEGGIDYDNSVIPLDFDDENYTTWGAKKDAMNVGVYAQYLIDMQNAVNTDITELPELVVAVLDTGIDTDHPWFENRFLIEDNTILGLDYTGINETGYPFEDDQGHGTHCAGIICDMTLPNVKILPIKFMYLKDDGNATGYASNAVESINYLLDLKENSHYNIVAMNMSFGHEYSSVSTVDRDFEVKINTAYAKEIFSVVAAGNDAVDASTFVPANIDKAITVGAIDPIYGLAYYSNYGDVIDTYAPGSLILSARNGGGTTNMSGTSMAAPHIAAYIALLRSDQTKHYEMSDIEQILNGTRAGYTRDLGSYIKNGQSYNFWMPIMDHAYPTYSMVNIAIEGKGIVGEGAGGYLFTEDDTSIIFDFTPNPGHHVAAVYVNGVLLDDSEGRTQYEITDPLNINSIEVEFEPDETTYTVNHYLQEIYDLKNEIGDKYHLVKTEELNGRVDDLTAAVAGTYLGFTAPTEIEQEIISFDGTTVVNIYYTRNIYNVIVRQNLPNGLSQLTGGGEYLYGSEVKLIPVVNIGYAWYTWTLDECADDDFFNEFNLTPSLMQQTFEMPAMNLTLTAHLKHQTFLISVKTVGQGVVSQNNITENYGKVVFIEFAPAKGYRFDTLQCDGMELDSIELEEMDDHTYKIYFYAVTNAELTITFVKISAINWMDIVVWGGGGFLALILFGGSIAILIIAFRGSKKATEQPVKKNQHQTSKQLPKNQKDRLIAALEFVDGHEKEFVKYCQKNHLDYEHKYNDAVLEYFEEQHKVK